jgi:hypothetical protein
MSELPSSINLETPAAKAAPQTDYSSQANAGIGWSGFSVA